MKLNTTILIAALAASPSAFAGPVCAKPAVHPAECPAIESEDNGGSDDSGVVVVDDNEVTDETEIIDDEVVVDDGEVIDSEDDVTVVDDSTGTKGEGGEEVTDLEVLQDGDGEPLPDVDSGIGGPEVQRGGETLENPNVIFQNTFFGGVKSTDTPLAKGAVELGQDDHAANIEVKGAGTAEVNKAKKGPVALVKKGRVFLR